MAVALAPVAAVPQARRDRLATLAALRALTDAKLKDIGLHRSEIGSLVFDASGARKPALRAGAWDQLLHR